MNKFMKIGNIYASIPSDLGEEVFELLVQTGNVKIERIISQGHSSPQKGWYDQDQNEWVIILKGEAIIAFENGQDIYLKKGDHLEIPAHTRHKVRWTIPKSETIWLAVHH
jgi:cupin 2 domain-containing protein